MGHVLCYVRCVYIGRYLGMGIALTLYLYVDRFDTELCLILHTAGILGPIGKTASIGT